MLQSTSIPRFTRVTLAYLGAVVLATLTFVVPWYIARVMLPLGMNPLGLDNLKLMTEFALVVAVVMAVTALVPCLLAEGLAGKAGIWAAWYYALWGAMTGLLFGSPIFALYRDFSVDASPPPQLWIDRLTMHLLRDGILFVFSGAIGGVAYWWISGKRTIAKTLSRLS